MKAKDRRRPSSTVSGRRFLSQKNLGEIRWVTAVMNSNARRAGKVPLKPQIFMWSCKCNCFHINVG